MITDLETLGPATLEMAALRIWVHGYQFPDLTDYWDGNWLRCTAHCAEAGASVRVTGAILETVSFFRFGRELADVYKRLEGQATLASHEPELKVELRAIGRKGDVEIVVEITPDHRTQIHRFSLTSDQSFLPEMIRQCNQLLDRYPVRDPQGRGL
jgi:hypothetical protein